MSQPTDEQKAINRSVGGIVRWRSQELKKNWTHEGEQGEKTLMCSLREIYESDLLKPKHEGEDVKFNFNDLVASVKKDRLATIMEDEAKGDMWISIVPKRTVEEKKGWYYKI